MKLRINIIPTTYLGLKKPVAQYNEWPYRTSDAALTKSLFEIELADFPVFWQQFLEHLPSVRKEMRAACLMAAREFSEDEAGISLKKALEVLHQV